MQIQRATQTMADAISERYPVFPNPKIAKSKFFFCRPTPKFGEKRVHPFKPQGPLIVSSIDSEISQRRYAGTSTRPDGAEALAEEARAVPLATAGSDFCCCSRPERSSRVSFLGLHGFAVNSLSDSPDVTFICMFQ